MPFTTQDNLLTLDAGLAHFKAVYMPARNYSSRTREEYETDIADLTRFLTTHGIKSWLEAGLRDLQVHTAELDRRGLEPSSRNRKTYSINTFFHTPSSATQWPAITWYRDEIQSGCRRCWGMRA
jgi:site-specific recombinase XerD